MELFEHGLVLLWRQEVLQFMVVPWPILVMANRPGGFRLLPPELFTRTQVLNAITVTVYVRLAFRLLFQTVSVNLPAVLLTCAYEVAVVACGIRRLAVWESLKVFRWVGKLTS